MKKGISIQWFEMPLKYGQKLKILFCLKHLLDVIKKDNCGEGQF